MHNQNTEIKAKKIIGICGGSATGKTETVKNLQSCLINESLCIPQDNYYLSHDNLSQDERNTLNFDDPNSLDMDLLTAHLKELKIGNVISIPTYSYVTHLRLDETTKVYPKNIVFLDGLYLFYHKFLRELIDIRIYIDVSEPVRLKRLITRNERERGESEEDTCRRFYRHVKPMHDLYVVTQKDYADIIVDGEKPLDEIKNEIIGYLSQQIQIFKTCKLPKPFS